MNVAVIPARSGSKRIPHKNIKEFCGNPIITWPISEAQKSGLFDHIIVSTDDQEIAELCRSCRAEVPFIRPRELSGDHTSISEVMSHSVKWMKEQDLHPEAVCCIFPTSVFLIKDDLEKGFEALKRGNWQFTFSVTDFEYPIFRSFKVLENGGVEMFFPENFEKRSQDLPVAFHDAAQFYWGKPDAWLKNLKMFDQHSFPVKIPRWRIQDIDSEDDWVRAEFIFENLRKQL